MSRIFPWDGIYSVHRGQSKWAYKLSVIVFFFKRIFTCEHKSPKQGVNNLYDVSWKTILQAKPGIRIDATLLQQAQLGQARQEINLAVEESLE